MRQKYKHIGGLLCTRRHKNKYVANKSKYATKQKTESLSPFSSMFTSFMVFFLSPSFGVYIQYKYFIFVKSLNMLAICKNEYVTHFVYFN